MEVHHLNKVSINIYTKQTLLTFSCKICGYTHTNISMSIRCCNLFSSYIWNNNLEIDEND